MLQLSRSARSITVRGALAAAMAMAAYGTTILPAQAERDVPKECANKPTEEAKLRCGVTHYEGKIVEAEARTAAAKARSAAAKAESADAKARSAEAKVRSDEAKAQIADAKARGAAADARRAEADKEGVCLKAIMTDLESNGAKTASLTAPPPKGEGCKLARSLKLVVGLEPIPLGRFAM